LPSTSAIAGERYYMVIMNKESGVTGDRRAVELQLDVAVEINTQGVIVALTHWVPRSFRQEVVGKAGFSGGKGANAVPKRPSLFQQRGHDLGYALLV
jgi:hypothetical protein